MGAGLAGRWSCSDPARGAGRGGRGARAGLGVLLPAQAPPELLGAANSESWSCSSQGWERVYPECAPEGTIPQRALLKSKSTSRESSIPLSGSPFPLRKTRCDQDLVPRSLWSSQDSRSSTGGARWVRCLALVLPSSAVMTRIPQCRSPPGISPKPAQPLLWGSPSTWQGCSWQRCSWHRCVPPAPLP